jgi:hypothetical protein
MTPALFGSPRHPSTGRLDGSRSTARVSRWNWSKVLDLLCLDEVGYVRLDPRGAELLFHIIPSGRPIVRIVR